MVSEMFRKLQNPRNAAIALGVVLFLFATVIFMTYPSGKSGQEQIPIVKADLSPIRSAPEDRGGMDIPNRDSTILARVGQPPIIIDGEEVENLLSSYEEDLVSKEEAIERAMAEHPMLPPEMIVEESMAAANQETQRPAVIVRSAEIGGAPQDEAGMEIAEAPMKPDFEIKEPSSASILQKIGETEIGNDNLSSEFHERAAAAAVTPKPERPNKMHAAATSPETLEFVRGILNESEDPMAEEEIGTVASEQPSVEELAGIEPALSSAGDLSSGAYFVQLASITDPARAGTEWTKMQVKYNVLSSAQFRVQEAILDHGTFFRIQAGPMSKEDANYVCNTLKQANKPGGCLVVK